MIKEIAYNSKADASVNHEGESDRGETAGFHWVDRGLGTTTSKYRYVLPVPRPKWISHQFIPLSCQQFRYQNKRPHERQQGSGDAAVCLKRHHSKIET